MDQLRNLEAWNVLASVCDAASMSEAAGHLGMEVSTVSRLIQGLEKGLGRDLVNRNCRPVVITDDGRNAVAAMRPVLKAHASVIARFQRDTSSMEGVIRFSVAGGLLHSKLMPLLVEFRNLYPGIDFDITSGLTVTDCLEGRVDVCSVSDEVTSEDIVSLPRGRSVFIPVASPEYLAKNGVPLSPEDLSRHAGFFYNGPVRSSTTELHKGDLVRPLAFSNRMLSSDILMIKKAVIDGMGVAVDLPLLHCVQELADGRLQLILGGWHRPPIPAYVVCSKANWHFKRMRVFMQWWSDRFQQEFTNTELAARKVLGDDIDIYLH